MMHALARVFAFALSDRLQERAALRAHIMLTYTRAIVQLGQPWPARGDSVPPRLLLACSRFCLREGL